VIAEDLSTATVWQTPTHVGKYPNTFGGSAPLMMTMMKSASCWAQTQAAASNAAARSPSAATMEDAVKLPRRSETKPAKIGPMI
jgi:hypothetical protein